jgi:HAD superfamily phosphatase (TIGR01668 family)
MDMSLSAYSWGAMPGGSGAIPMGWPYGQPQVNLPKVPQIQTSFHQPASPFSLDTLGIAPGNQAPFQVSDRTSATNPAGDQFNRKVTIVPPQAVSTQSSQPDFKFRKFSDLNSKNIQSKGEVRGIVFDVDDTLSRFQLLGHRSIPPELKQQLKTLQDKDHIKLGIVSNNPNPDTVIQFQKELAKDGIYMDVIANAEKPSTKGLKEMQEKFRLPSDQILMVGDSPLTDIPAGKAAGFKTAQVDWFGESSLHKEGMILADKTMLGIETVKSWFHIKPSEPKFFGAPSQPSEPATSDTNASTTHPDSKTSASDPAAIPAS